MTYIDSITMSKSISNVPFYTGYSTISLIAYADMINLYEDLENGILNKGDIYYIIDIDDFYTIASDNNLHRIRSLINIEYIKSRLNI